MPSASPRRKHSRGPDGLVRWTDTHAAAWIGLLETHKHLTRELVRLTTLADAAGLSLSRVSRILDTFEQRGLVERRADTDDTRAKKAWLTPQGLELLRAAQRTHFAAVERLFFDHVPDEDVETLARVFKPFRL